MKVAIVGSREIKTVIEYAEKVGRSREIFLCK